MYFKDNFTRVHFAFASFLQRVERLTRLFAKYRLIPDLVFFWRSISQPAFVIAPKPENPITQKPASLNNNYPYQRPSAPCRRGLELTQWVTTTIPARAHVTPKNNLAFCEYSSLDRRGRANHLACPDGCRFSLLGDKPRRQDHPRQRWSR